MGTASRVPFDKVTTSDMRTFLDDLSRRGDSFNTRITSVEALITDLGIYNVKDYGAVGDNSTDCTTAITEAITDANADFTCGTVFFPPGAYKITSGLTVPGGVRLLGSGVEATAINGQSGDYTTIAFTGNGEMERLFVQGYFNAAATANCVTTAAAKRNLIRDCYIWGGNFALLARGDDGWFENLFVSGYNSGHLYISGGSNWYNKVKCDDNGANSVVAAIVIDAGAAAGIIENRFSMCDASGSFSAGSMLIDDGDQATSFSQFNQCVFSSEIQISQALHTGFTMCTFGDDITITNDCNTIIANSYSFAAITPAGAATIITGNYNIS